MLAHRVCVRANPLLICLSIHVLVLAPARVYKVTLLGHAHWLAGDLRVHVGRLLWSLVLRWRLHALAVVSRLVCLAVRGLFLVGDSTIIVHGRHVTDTSLVVI